MFEKESMVGAAAQRRLIARSFLIVCSCRTSNRRKEQRPYEARRFNLNACVVGRTLIDSYIATIFRYFLKCRHALASIVAVVGPRSIERLG
jgi:hypothetical protein